MLMGLRSRLGERGLFGRGAAQLLYHLLRPLLPGCQLISSIFSPGSAPSGVRERDVLNIRRLNMQGNQNTALDLLWSHNPFPPSLPLLKNCAADEIQVSVISTHSMVIAMQALFPRRC